MTNVAAGGAAGGLAAAATTPFDVIKTHMQTLHGGSGARPPKLSAAVASIVQKGGMGALFAGWAPRAMRGGVAYSILMGSYEQWKQACTSQPLHAEDLPLDGSLAASAAPCSEVPEPDAYL